MSATKRVRVSGNPVGIGDGCATVSGDKLSETTGLRAGKVKVRFEAASQDTGSEVLVRALPGKGRVCFSAKEKDEAKFALGARQRMSSFTSWHWIDPAALVFELKDPSSTHFALGMR